jgi:hypothetical protein
MAVGRIYVNEGTGGETLVDFSLTPSYVLERGECFGFALAKTFEALTIDHSIDNDGHRLILKGNADSVRENLPALQQQAGKVASVAARLSRGAFPEHDGQTVNTIIEGLLSKLPDTITKEPFSHICGDIIYPFGDAAMPGDELLEMHYESTAPWRRSTSEQRAHDAAHHSHFHNLRTGGYVAPSKLIPSDS